ncbi:hypothetical protein JNB91_25460 [Rhizobium wenxiniae]|uniref:hypothetical protein n=1 Tax=Rhizobium wenxiniae TaxID=1737357 RepID=UPI001C6EA627|nr:hypothetical protein [Rhizobium wenxiniae]MBW9091165.1 hypothetical protein [Rhizobium wenxiniae]
MLTQILLTSVLLPLVLGIVIALAGKGASSPGILLTTLLIPVAGAIASVSIEGFPPFPPIAAKQKLPLLLLIGGVAFGILGVLLRQFLNRWTIALVGVVSLAAPAWWLGKNVLAANATKATTLAVVLVIVAVEIAAVSGRLSQKQSPAALPAALLATAIGTALSAIMGGYIGMAQMNGALAALFGGWLLVRYVAYIRGDDAAFDLQGLAALSFIWTAAMGVMMTVLLSPSATPIALVLSVLPVAVFAVLKGRSIDFIKQPRFLRPLIIGALTAIPAIAAIAIAVLAGG